jgi:hypothetical protein
MNMLVSYNWHLLNLMMASQAEICRSINNITDDKLVVFLTILHCTVMSHTQRGWLNLRSESRVR